MKENLADQARKAWQWLLGQAHRYAWQTALAVAAIAIATNLLGGAWLSGWQGSWVDWLDKTVTVFTAVSLAFAWGFALVVRAQRHHAAIAFRNAGAPLDTPNFDAAVILASSSDALMDWHLWNMGEKRVEFVWTEQRRSVVAAVLATHDSVCCLHGPDRDGELPLADPFRLQEVKVQCSILLREILAQYPSHKVCVDVTGGTVPMSLAAFQVAEELGVTSVYLMGTHKPANGASPQIRRDHTHERAEGNIVILSDHRNQRIDAPMSAPACGGQSDAARRSDVAVCETAVTGGC